MNNYNALVELAPRIANVAMRGLAMGSRFALVIALAHMLEPSAVGLYGLFTATVGFSMLMVGGDYYTYSQRELLSRPQQQWSFVLQHQIIAISVLYLLLLPTQLLLFWFELIPWSQASWFFTLLIAEHLAQEVNRLLIAMHRQLWASAVLFIRMGVWVWLVFLLMWLHPAYRIVDTVFALWLLGCLWAIILGGVVIWHDVQPWRFWPVDVTWLKQGFIVGLMFLGSTMCFRALQTFDRYAVEALAGLHFLGVYVLYMGMAMAVVNVLEPAVVAFLYPRLIATYRQGNITEYNNLMWELTYSIVFVSTATALVIGFTAPWVLVWIGKPIYVQHIAVLWGLLLMTVIYAIGLIPHYGLYAHGADQSIVVAHLSSLLIFAIVLLALARLVPTAATVYALIAAFTWIGLFKAWHYSTLPREESVNNPITDIGDTTVL